MLLKKMKNDTIMTAYNYLFKLVTHVFTFECLYSDKNWKRSTKIYSTGRLSFPEDADSVLAFQEQNP